ncbi:response regulator [Thermodesulfobacteriota bacterium]
MKGTKILLLDETESSRPPLVDDLEKFHFSVTVAPDVSKVLNDFSSDFFDLVIIDIMIESTLGVYLLKEIKKRNPETVVILITSPGDLNSAINALHFGADDYLQKPYDIKELLIRITRCFSKQNTSSQLKNLEESLMIESARRREAEERHKDSEEKLRFMFETVDESIMILNRNGKLIDLNRAALSCLGYNKDALLGKHISTMDQNDFFNQLPERIAEIKKFGETEFTSTYTRKDNTVFPVSIQVRETVFNGETVYFTFFNNLTEQIQIEKKIHQAQEEWDRTFNAIGDCVTIQDGDMRIIKANRATSDTLNTPLEDIIGKTCYELFRGATIPCEGCPALANVHDEPPWTSEIIHPELEKTFLVSLSPIIGEEGGLIGYVHSAKDITQRKKLQSQLHQALKMEALGRLTGGIAHDFNNHLTSIVGYSELALKNISKDSGIKEYITNINQSGSRASELTRQLMAFSRKEIMEMKAINLNQVVTDMTKMMQRMIGEEIEVIYETDSEIKSIIADQSHLEQIIMNLAINAKDAMPNGGPLFIATGEVSLDAKQAKSRGDLSPGSYVTLTVEDTGEGIPQALHAQIFEPFFTTKESGKGTGLGLSTVYGIVKQHNGFITVSSELNQGSVFTVYLPIADQKADEIPLGIPETLRSGNETVLVVDDDESVRQFVTDTLQPLGYRVVEASSGMKALDFSKDTRENIDILLTDIVMPGMNGMELAEIIQPARPGIKVVFMSGYTNDAIPPQTDTGKPKAFLDKPFTPSRLTNTLREVVDQDH